MAKHVKAQTPLLRFVEDLLLYTTHPRQSGSNWSLGLNAVAARPLMLSHCLATSPTDTYNDVTIRQQHQHPVTSLLHSPTSLTGVAVVGDRQYSVVSPVNSSPESSTRPWPTSPTDHQRGLFQPDAWVRGSAESLVGHVRNILHRLLLIVSKS